MNPMPSVSHESSLLGDLADLTGEIAKAYPLTIKAERILDAVLATSGAEFAVIGAHDADNALMRTLAHRPAAMSVDAFQRRGESIGGYIAEIGQPYKGRYAALPLPTRDALAEHHVLAFPIAWDGELFGYLAATSTQPTFVARQAETIELIAGIAAIAFEHARLSNDQERTHQAAVVAERERLARELHDNVTQILSSMSLLSQTLTTAWERSPEEGARRAARLQQLAQTAFAEMRMLLHQLAPAQLGSITQVSRRSRVLVGVENLREHALPSALTKLLAATVPETIIVKSNFSGYVPQKLDSEEALYRVCQEAISNTIRHAGAQRIRVEAAVTATHAVLRVADDGRGLDTVFRPGVGLGSMRTRVEHLQGQFRIAQNTPHGTLVEARVPRHDRPEIT